LPLPFAANPIGKPFIELQSVDSTNKYAIALVRNLKLPDGQGESQHGMVVFAHHQTDGKGQRGKKWVSEKGGNITLSILLNPDPLRLTDQFKLSICIAVSVATFFSKYAGDEIKIKWPNDIYWRDRKAGGILIENIVRNQDSEVSIKKSGKWKWAVAGIGLNINQTVFPTDLPNPVSLKQITGKNFEPVVLAKELCSAIEKNYQILLKDDFESFFIKYQEMLYKKDEKVKLKKGNRVFDSLIKGVNKSGHLITEHSIEEIFEFGEVEWII